MTTPKLTRYSGGGDWSALYVDGILDKVGDHYLVDERISQLAGVETIDGDEFMRGGNHREDVAPTLADLDAYTAQERAAETAALLKTADDFQRQADKMRERARMNGNTNA